MNWKNFIAGIWYSLLPKRWWANWEFSSTSDFARSGVVCGLIEFLVFSRLTLLWLARFMIARSKLVAGAGMNQGTQLWVLAIFLVDFMIQPLSLVLVYFALEGFARGYTAWLHGIVLPTLPFHLIAKWQSRHEHRANDNALGPHIADIVEHLSPGEVRIASSRPKDWSASITIAYNDQMWELLGCEQAAGPRMFIYRLKVRTSNVAIRAIRTYEPGSENSRQP